MREKYSGCADLQDNNYIECTCNSLDEFHNLYLTLGNNQQLVLSPEKWMIYESGYCIVTLLPNNQFSIFGIDFVYDMYLTFDRVNKKIGFYNLTTYSYIEPAPSTSSS